MKRKFLEDMGLSKEQIDKILDENSQDIGKAKNEVDSLATKLNTAQAEITALQGQIADRDNQLNDLKEIDAQGLQAEITRLQAENDAAQERYKADIEAVKLEAAIDVEILNAKGRNGKAIKALIDREKLKLKDDGTIEGLDIALLKKSDPYLFDEVQTKSKGNPLSTGDNGTDISKMSYEELAAFMEENPDVEI